MASNTAHVNIDISTGPAHHASNITFPQQPRQQRQNDQQSTIPHTPTSSSSDDIQVTKPARIRVKDTETPRETTENPGIKTKQEGDKGEEQEGQEDDGGDDDDDEDKEECRICRESYEPLISPCKCNTVVHAVCLKKWVGYRADALFPLLTSSVRDTCEVCRHPIDTDQVKFTSSAQSCTKSTPSTTARSFMLPSMLNQLWMSAFTVETCLFVFLFVLAVMGHALFVMGVFKGAEHEDEHSHKRVVLALANAVVTFTLLLCVQKVVVRWLRESDANYNHSNHNHNHNYNHTQNMSVDNSAGGHVDVQLHNVTVGSNHLSTSLSSDQRYASRCTTVSQVILGALLSVVAAAEIFLIIRELPVGGLA